MRYVAKRNSIKPGRSVIPLALSRPGGSYRSAVEDRPCFDTAGKPGLLSTSGASRGPIGRNKGFTLIELLVVMAISIILMGLVLYPVYQSFVITRQAQAMVDSQDAARTALQTMSRELGQAMYVFDNAEGNGFIANNPENPAYSFNDFKDGVPSCPVEAECRAPIMLPVAQPSGVTRPGSAKRWFVLPYGKIDFILPKLYMHCNNPNHPAGKPRDYPRDLQNRSGNMELRDWPNCPYCEYDGLTATDVEAQPKTPLEQDTTVVRYFLALRDNRLGVPPSTGAPDNAGWVSPWGKNVVDGTENQVILYRAEFNPADDTLFPANMPRSQRLVDPFFFYRESTRDRWMKVARVVGIGKYEDLVTATRDGDTVLTVQPTITFRMASIDNDTFAPAYDGDKQNEYAGAPATVFAGSYGYWTPGSRIEVMRDNYCPNPPSGVDFYTEVDKISGELMIIKVDPTTGGGPQITNEFNISDYRRLGYVEPSGPGGDPIEMAFDLDENKGIIKFALQPIREKLNSNDTSYPASGPVCRFVPKDINDDFKTAYLTDRYGARRNVRAKTMDPAFNEIYLQNARIAPGSDRIIGPDMTFGPHYGLPVRYERIPLGLRYPGPNQYQIDCDSGWIMFSPDPNLALPETYKDIDGNSQPTEIQVSYLVYFNKSDDVIRGDYLTKSLINIQMGMRMFDPDKGQPYPVDLTNSVKVRNALR